MGTIKGVGQKRIFGLGELYESFIVALPVISAVQFISVLAILYSEIKPYLLAHMPWITILHFLGFLTIILLIAMLLVYKYLLPSVWTFRGNQMFRFDSEVKDKLDEILKKLKEEEK